MRSYLRTVLVITLMFAAGAETLLAQIEIAPVRILLSSRQRDIQVVVTNSLDETVEAAAMFNYKVLRTDSLGNRTLDSSVSVAELAYSCRDWLKIYPQKLLLPPRASRSIRILISPPDSIADGEYWARLEITGERVGIAAPATTDTNLLVVDLRQRLRVGIPLTFRKGDVSTGLQIDSVQAQRLDSGIALLVDSKRLGNGVYRGTMIAQLRAADGSEIFQGAREFTNETALRNNFPLPALSAGFYDLTLQSESRRSGTQNEMVLAAPPVSAAYRLAVSDAGIVVTETK